ncbi:MAG: DUF1772 domain-containing protein [Micrococcales bacterium]|nr:DUF1772 domain-containing protein [Micrococcales bacterium]
MPQVLLVAATVSSGLLAGVYLLYAHTVVPALRDLPDAVAVSAFAALDRRIVNPWFMATAFLGAPVLTAAALVAGSASQRGWVGAALVLHLVATVVTVRIHLPRNDALKAAVTARDDATAARPLLDEPTWVRWNLVRVVVSVAATALVATALARG